MEHFSRISSGPRANSTPTSGSCGATPEESLNTLRIDEAFSDVWRWGLCCPNTIATVDTLPGSVHPRNRWRFTLDVPWRSHQLSRFRCYSPNEQMLEEAGLGSWKNGSGWFRAYSNSSGMGVDNPPCRLLGRHALCCTDELFIIAFASIPLVLLCFHLTKS